MMPLLEIDFSAAIKSNLLIYRIINLKNNKSYIGKTKKGLYRIKEHILCRNHKRYRSKPLYQAFAKYGLEFFALEILEYLGDEKNLNDREIYWINFHRTRNIHGGYNICKGGDGGNNWEGITKEERQRRIEKQKLNQKEKYTEERKKLLSENLKKLRKTEIYKNNQLVNSQRMKRLNANTEWREQKYEKRRMTMLERTKSGDLLKKKFKAYILKLKDGRWQTQFRNKKIGRMPSRIFTTLDEAILFRNQWLKDKGVTIPQEQQTSILDEIPHHQDKNA